MSWFRSLFRANPTILDDNEDSGDENPDFVPRATPFNAESPPQSSGGRQMNHLFYICLRTQGLTVRQCLQMARQDVLTIDNLAFLTPEQTNKFLDDLTPPMNTMLKAKLVALRAWYDEQRHIKGRDADIDLFLFTDEEMTRIQNSLKLRKETAAITPSKGVAAAVPSQFSGERSKWLQWNNSWWSYLSTEFNPNQIPLVYVIRGLRAVDDFGGLANTFVNRILRAPLTGDVFDQDNYRVFQLLSSFMPSKGGHTQISSHKNDGRGAYRSLIAYYEGEEARLALLAEADRVLDETKFFGQRRNFTFETYTQRFLGAYQTKEQCHEPVAPQQQVRKFIAGIKYDKLSVIASNIVGDKELNCDLQRAAARIGDLANIQGLFKDPYQRDVRSIGATSQRGGRGPPFFRGGRGRGGRFGRGGGRFSSPGRGGGGRFQGDQRSQYGQGYLRPDQANMLNAFQRKCLYTGREMLSRQQQDDSSARAPSVSSTSASTQQRNVSHVNTNPDEQPQQLQQPQPQDQQQEDVSEITEDSASARFGRASYRTTYNQLQQPRKRPRSHGAVHSHARYVATVSIRDSRLNVPDDYDCFARAEIDSRADTTCAGSTFYPLLLTDEITDVAGFHSSMPEIKSVPIATACTAYDCPRLQETLILVFPQCLYFGKDLGALVD